MKTPEGTNASALGAHLDIRTSGMTNFARDRQYRGSLWKHFMPKKPIAPVLPGFCVPIEDWLESRPVGSHLPMSINRS
jgi:hypothetical protein